jgi:hypothetical protein
MLIDGPGTLALNCGIRSKPRRLAKSVTARPFGDFLTCKKGQ